VQTSLAEELQRMAAEDHELAPRALGGDVEVRLAWHRVTADNADRLAEILDRYGWPTAAVVGEEAARAAWLIAQHADRQLDVQRRALRLLADSVDRGEASARDLAFLRDRVRVNEGRPQVYGTQVAAVVDGAPVPWPCVEPDRLDERRAEVGIASFAAHTARHTTPDTVPRSVPG
jgi:peptidoglycan/xylan/chitin deacetylase (PgdA/CDA1 family)